MGNKYCDMDFYILKHIGEIGMKKIVMFFATLTIAILVSCSDNNDISEKLLLDDLIVFEGESSPHFLSAENELLLFEEIAVFATHYISELFGDEFNGKYLQLTYEYDHYISQHIWVGKVAYLMEDFDTWDLLFMLEFDAITGKRLFFSNLSFDPLYGINDFAMTNMEEAQLLELFPEPNDEEIATMKEVIRHYAERHFSDSTIVVLEYGFYTLGGIPDITYYASQNSPFFVIDDRGRVAEIIIQRETHQLLMIITYP